MGTTIDDIYYEQHLEESQWTEKIEEEIEKFKKGSLKRFYLEKNRSYKEVLEVEKVASSLKQGDFVAPAFVFYSICIELIIKDLFVLPLVYGSLLDEEVAEIIIAEIFRTSVSRFDKLVPHVTKKFGGIDLTKKKESLNFTPWTEIKRLRNIRNKIVHSSSSPKEQDLKNIIGLSDYLLKEVVPKVFNGSGVRINNKEIIVDR